MRELLLRVLAEVLKSGVVSQDAGKNLEVRDASGKRVGYGLEDIKRHRLFIGLVALRNIAISASRDFALDPFVLGRRGRVIDAEIHDAVRADVAQPGAEN